MNPLDSRPKVRAAVYLAQWFVNLVLGIVSIVLVALQQNPLWWIIVQAVFNFVWTYTGITAKNNVSYDNQPDTYVEPEVTDAEPDPSTNVAADAINQAIQSNSANQVSPDPQPGDD